jgi:hypothetical protein
MIRMTQVEAKCLALRTWRYFTKYPNTMHKKDLPISIWNKIKKCRNLCPLCELFYEYGFICPRCPFKSCAKGGRFTPWDKIKKVRERRKYAQENVDIIKAWKPRKRIKYS